MMREDTSLGQFTQGRVNVTWERLQCTTRLACLYPSGKNNKPQACQFGFGAGPESDSQSEDCYHLQMIREETKLDISPQNSTGTDDTWERLQCTVDAACAYPAAMKPKACRRGSESEDETYSGNSGGLLFQPGKKNIDKRAIARVEQEEHEMPPSMDYDVEVRFLAVYLSLDWATRQVIGHQVGTIFMEYDVQE